MKQFLRYYNDSITYMYSSLQQPDPPTPTAGKQGGKRGGKGGDEKPNKKFKDNSARAVQVNSTPGKNKGKAQVWRRLLPDIIY